MKKHQIRIVGGTYRKTPIPVPPSDHLRPTPDRVRETLFNWLHHLWGGRFAGRRVLDLFAGTGALGFEAASRGVAEACLVESSAVALRGLRATQARLQSPAIRIHAGDALAFLRHQAQPRFDLLLLDPPFGAHWLERTLPLAGRALVPGGLIYLESEAPLPVAPPRSELVRHAKAGRVHYGLIQFAALQENRNNDPGEPGPPTIHPSEAE
ncbi:RsmD family RNA methyltransferase [Castellaniella sp.]|uniref:RsmD family RNA methyltransferase n=1 Tax=Castellaniella sp. TaxID=1955812 RepID=UPI00356629E9